MLLWFGETLSGAYAALGEQMEGPDTGLFRAVQASEL